ncbi:MAG: KdsC family phosphatase [Elusimicrobiota bacterium]
MNKNLKKKFSKVDIVFMDIDGVMTDGRVVYIGGSSPRIWYVRDRMAVKILKGINTVKVIWITGREGKDLEKVAEELSVDKYYSDINDKLKIVKENLDEFNIEKSRAMYIGDDLIDLKCMSYTGISCCPSDAVDEVKKQADFISKYPGGRGAVRQIIEKILICKGLWKDVVKRYKLV